MRYRALLTALIAVFACTMPANAQPAWTRAPLLREVDVDGDTVRLGQPLGGAEKWVAVKGDTLVRVPPTYFGEDADGLLIVRDGTGPVVRFALLYADTRNVDAMVGAHMRDYGRGAVYSSAPVPEGLRENWTWSDGKTSLTLTRFTPAQNGIAAIRQFVDLVPAAPPITRAQPLAFLEGCWERRTATGIGREEWRRTPTGLDGGAASFRGDTLSGWEFLRVTVNARATDGTYMAAPSGQPSHTFALRAASADSAHFADPAHDSPKHLVYRRAGRDSLLALVYDDDPARALRLAFARVTCAPGRDLTRAVATRDTLQQLLDSLHTLGTAPGLSAAVALPDGRTITVTSGLADSTGRVPLTPTHRLLAGSTGKTFFAALALQLVGSGQLELDAPIARWLGTEPWFGRLPNGAQITVRQLMNHTSGLVRYEFDPAFARDLAADPLRAWQVQDQLAYVFDKPAPFAAGTSWEYSDTNYLVLALIVERIIGGTAYDAIRERFLAPLRLRGTVPSVSTRIPALANGYVAANDPLGMRGAMLQGGALALNPAFEWAGGGFASTPEDLSRWAQAWYTGRAVPPAQLALALDGVPARGLGAGARYGLGVIIRDTPLGVIYGHSGFFPGYLTEMRFYAQHGIAVTVMANTSDGRAIGRGLGAIAHALAERAIAR